MSLELYPWQKECIQTWLHHGSHGIVNVITGAGKTIMALAAAADLGRQLTKPLHVKIVVPTTAIMFQWGSALAAFSVMRHEIGYYCGSRKDSGDRSYMLYVVNSARYALARHIIDDISHGYAVLLIADECHHYASAENRKIFDFLPFAAENPGYYYSMGLSATPQTLGYESVLVPALGKELYHYGFSDAIAKHTINRFVIFQIALALSPEESMEYLELSDSLTIAMNRLMARCPFLNNLSNNQFFSSLNHMVDGADPTASALAKSVLFLSYKRKSLVCTAEARIHCVCELIKMLDSQSKIIIFGERIEQAELVYEKLSKLYPNKVGRYHSQMDKQARQTILDRYRTGELRILVSCRALDEGFDVPEASIGIVLSSTSVDRQRIQRLGRILRHWEGKEISSLYYLYIADSSEESTFFSELPQGSHVCSLSYSTSTKSFSHPDYENAAALTLSHLTQQSADAVLLTEAKQCLATGIVRPDWLLDAKSCEKKILAAATTRERNYWLCMKQMTSDSF